ncbi:MAG: NADH:ubiquinone oxidoreductase subunit 6 (subunit J), partial [Mariniblastus sp.]
MRNFILTTMAVLTVSSCFSQTLLSQNDATQDKTPGEFQREIFVPFESLDILLDGNSNRVLLSRDEYTTLLKSARTREIKRAPFDSAVVSAKYTAVVFEGVAMIKGELIVEQLNEGLVQIPLPFSGVAIRSARLGDQPAKLWRNPKGEIVLLVSNQKRESLVVEMTVPMQTSAARQTMSIQLPSPSATKLSLNVPGNVEVKSGVPVVNRAYNEDNNTTNFDLLVTRKPMNIVMSLNNRLLKDEQVAVSRSVMIHKLTPHSQEIHVTCSLDVIHGALETVEFVVPADFQVSQVNTELMSQWKIKEPPTGSGETGTRLVVELRQPTREDFVLNITATRNQGVAGAWESKDIRPVDVAGHVSVVGVLADVELKSSKLNSEGVIPIDHEFLMAAIPDSVQSTNRGNSTTIVAAYYAPQREYSISASFSVPSPELIVKSNSRLVIDNQHLELQGGISLVSRHDSRFGFKLSLPNAWRLIELTGIDGQPIRFDRVGVEGRSQFLVHLPTRIPSAASTKVFFRASKTPDGWLEKWESNQIAFPMLMIDGETKHSGAIAISSDEDLAIKPLDESNLNLLDEADKKKFELSHDNAPLAYQFQNSNYKLNLELNRLKPSIIARTYNYATIKPTQMAVHAELIYDVKQASEGEFKFQLPLESPKSISITGVSNQLKDYRSEDTETAREWTVQLAKPRMGQVHLQVDYQMPLDESQLAELVLVPVAIRDVNFQSSMFAVEGSSELDIEIETQARSIDIGEFTAATYQPGRHLLGAYSWPNEEMSLTVKSLRRPVYALPSAIVQRAEMVTSISTNGKSQTAARFLLATKQQPFLRVELPANATLWSVQLDGEPAKPQLQGDALLISLIGSETGKLRNLQMVFEVPAEAFNLAGKVQANAPTLWLKNTNDSNGNQVPLVDLNWRLILPDGFAVSHDDGKFQSKQLVSRPSPIQQIGSWLFHLGGGNLLSHRNYQEKSVSGWGFYTPIDDSKSLASPEEQFAGRSSGDLYFLKDDVQFNQDMEEDSKKHNFDKEEAKKPAEDAPLSPAKISPPLGGQSRTVETRSAGQGLFGNSQTRDENKPASNWALSGLRSLNIELTETGNSIEFYNLGEQPSLNVTVINQSRLNWLAIALATLIAAIGVLLTNRRLKAKMFFIFTILVMACLVPLAGTSLDAFRTVIDLATLAAVGVAIYFVIAALIIRIGRSFSTVLAKIPLSLLVAAIAMGYGNESMAKQNPLDPFSGSQSDTTQLKQLITELQSPVKVELPKDAIIIPFDADDPQGREKADRLLLPYEHYLKLINKAELGAEPSKIVSPVDYILSSAKYDIQLTLDEDITIHGKLVIELMTDEPVAVALPLLGGALADANVDGKPAKLQFDGGSNLNRSTKMKASASVVQLHLNGRGQKTLEFTVRIKPSRQGGWRLLDARLPVGLTRELNLTSLAEATEIRLNSDSDQRSIEAKPKQQIETVLSANGTLRLQWKPSTATQIVDQSLTARSEAVFDVREDGLRLNWRVDLDFRGSERDLFTLNLPEEFLVEQVSGENIRAWSVQQEGNFSRLQLVTLSPAKDKESFTIELSRRDFTVDNTTTQFDAPYLTVEGAALHKGLYTVRRSPIIELKTTKQKSASRIDQNPSDSRIDMGVIDSKSSPLGIEAFQVLQFVTTPFQIGLQAQLVPRTIKAETQSVLRIGQTE